MRVAHILVDVELAVFGVVLELVGVGPGHVIIFNLDPGQVGIFGACEWGVILPLFHFLTEIFGVLGVGFDDWEGPAVWVSDSGFGVHLLVGFESFEEGLFEEFHFVGVFGRVLDVTLEVFAVEGLLVEGFGGQVGPLGFVVLKLLGVVGHRGLGVGHFFPCFWQDLGVVRQDLGFS